jgi:hypothetical protein
MAFPSLMVSEMKLDPEEQIIAAALDQADLDEADERVVGADRVPQGRSREGDDDHFARAGREGRGAQLVDWRTLRGGSPDSSPRRV